MPIHLPNRKLSIKEDDAKVALSSSYPVVRCLVGTYNMHVVLDALCCTYLETLEDSGLSQEAAERDAKRIEFIFSKYRHDRKAATASVEVLGRTCKALSRQHISSYVTAWILGGSLHKIVCGLYDAGARDALTPLVLRMAGLLIATDPRYK